MLYSDKPCFIINADFIEPPEGIRITNFCFDDEPQFKHKNRTKLLEHFVLHETAGRSASGCKRTLLKRGYGVHLILARNGSLSQHGDLVADTMVHANQLNKTSVGIEIVNPYAPMLAKRMLYKSIPAEWWTWCPDKEDRRYILPTPAQLKTLRVVIPWLCQKLDIPYIFPTKYLSRKQRQVKRAGILRRRIPEPGVVAHCDFAKHADGRYPLEYLIKHADII